jgi:hypothetical protein
MLIYACILRGSLMFVLGSLLAGLGASLRTEKLKAIGRHLQTGGRCRIAVGQARRMIEHRADSGHHPSDDRNVELAGRQAST